MNGLLWFVGKLAVLTILAALVFGFLLPQLGIDPDLVRSALWMVLGVWTLWVLRNWSQGGGS